MAVRWSVTFGHSVAEGMMRRREVHVLFATVGTVILISACGDSTRPSELPEPGVMTLAVGGHHACRLTDEGVVSCWGRADAGQLGIGTTPFSGTVVPVSVNGVTFTTVAAGGLHTCALAVDGVPWCWGQNGSGQAGFPISENQDCGEPVHGWRCVPAPRPVQTDQRFTALVAGGSNTCGFNQSGLIYCWGANGSGQIGAAATDDCGGSQCSWSPLALAGPPFRVLALGASAHICGLTADGKAYCWGANGGGQLGMGTVGGLHTLAETVAGNHRFKAIAVGGEHTCALDTEGKPWCWGRDILPPGDGGVSQSTTPVAIEGAPALADIITGTWAACGRTSAGAVWCWGINAYGEMGLTPAGLNVRYDTPTEMAGHTAWDALGGEAATFCGMERSGATWCWGYGVLGVLGPVH
jgi:alpha-tubulin suppressor-like RCC1 family protein